VAGGLRAAAWAQAGVLLGAFAGSYLLFVCTPAGQHVDAAGFGQVPELDTALHGILEASRLVVPLALGVVVAVLAIGALVQRRVREVLGALALVVISSLAAVAAKPLLPRPRFGENGYPWNTFPSGHTAVATALLCAALWLAPRRLSGTGLRVGLVVLGTAFGWALVVSYAHRQADVAGSGILVAAVAALIAALQGRVALPNSTWRRLAAVAAVGVALQAIAAYAPGLAGLRFAGALGTVLVIAASCAAALALVPSGGRGGRPAVQRLVGVDDARKVELPRPL
jgi:membrane-associated phospholipid phosphatase